MLRQVKPRTARSKRALDTKAPKVVENPKTALLLRGTSCSQVLQDAITDFYSLRRPLAIKFQKKNSIHPFEDPSSLEFFSEKNDAAILVFGHSSKKRPHCMTLARTFNHKIYDMLELYLDPESFRQTSQFKGRKIAIGLRPMILFSGTAFDGPLDDEYKQVKSFFIDFFKGDVSDKVDVEGLQCMVHISAEEPVGDDANAKPVVHLRVYLINTKRSGQRLPRVEVEEMGPRMDFRIGRLQQPDEATAKEALKKPKIGEEKTKKNVVTDAIGDKLGRIHLGRQDLSELQTRKMKGLKRSLDVEDAPEGASDEEPKRSKK